jgi:hypothetical protein
VNGLAILVAVPYLWTRDRERRAASVEQATERTAIVGAAAGARQ